MGEPRRRPRRPTRRQDESAIELELPAPGSEIEKLLAEGRIVACQPLDWGSNYDFAVAIAPLGDDDDSGANATIAIYKPRRGEAPLWDFPDGTLYRREYAAYLTSVALNWRFIPPTVIRDGPYGVGSVQLYVEPARKDVSFNRSGYRTQLMQVSLFDSLTNNADRKAGHCFIGRDGKLWGIDHGLTFHHVPKLRTVIWDFCGDPIPSDLLAALERLLDARDEASRLWGQLERLLSEVEVEACQRRLQRLLSERRFPRLDPSRNLPRGFF